NTVPDSLVENLVIADELPEGLSFVDGSLKTSDGGKASFEDGKVTVSFGDVTDNEWRTVTFQTKIESDYAGKGIENVAVVSGDNIDTPDHPSKGIDVDPQEPEEPVDTEGSSNTPSDNTTATPLKAEKPSNVTGTDTNEKPQAEEAKYLPKTATNVYNLLIAGFSLLILGLAIWFVRRKKAN
ncbi:hypothetical protein CHH91_07490, partial [Virgibacillus sp. 7505]|uniref:LPXTG cell wall anchor domain-containing protein n=1 Tax=Virgibacillus sp. 7505 TaxID=2022548 RepID=UPI000BCD34E6